MMIFKWGISLLLALQTIGKVQEATSKKNFPQVACFLRDFGEGRRVCVCNGTYCDTVLSLPPFPSRIFNLYESDKRGWRFAFRRKKFSSRTYPMSATISVNSSAKYQKILGFGGTLSDAAALNADSLSANARANLLASYFSDAGIEYDIVRVVIGGNDYSNRSYTLDEEPGDSSLGRFSLSHEDVTLKIPYLKTAKKIGRKEIRIVATAWTAPPWMKTNGDYKGFGVLKDEYYSLWSKYHLRFLEEYAKHGLPVWAVTTGHQPSSGLIPFFPYNCMGWTPFSQGRWISENLGPDLKNSKFNATKIIALDDTRFFLPWWPKLMFDSYNAKSFVSGIGVQWYWNFIFPQRLLELTHSEFPGKFILCTEASFSKPKGFLALGSWERAEEYAASMIDDLNHWTSGWVDSNLALDLQGGPSWAGNSADAAIVVNSSADEFYKQPIFYAIGHFSKFIPRGSYRIDVRVSKMGIKATGFRTPSGNVVIVLVNKRTYDIPVTIVGARKGNANISLPKKSIITVIYRDKKY